MKLILNCKKSVPFSLSQNEIIGMIDPAHLEAIKKNDASPLFKAYILAAEGNAYPEVIKETGERSGGVVVWTKNAIKQVAQAVKAGLTKLFVNHTEWRNHGEHGGLQAYQEARSGANRPAEAYVAASSTREHNGKLYNVIVSYFPPETRQQAQNLNAVSMEVEYEAMQGQNQSTIVDKVLNVFGIALLGPGQDPAFEAATSVGVAHAHKFVGHYFQDDQTNQRAESPQQPERNQKMSLKEASFEELKTELLSRNAQAWQLVDFDKLRGRPVKLRDGSIQWIGGDVKFQEMLAGLKEEIRAEIEDKAAEDKKQLQDRIKQLEPLEKEIKTFKAIPVLDKKLEAMKVSPTVKAAVKRAQESFVPGENIEEDAEAFITKVKEEAEFYAKQYGATPADEGPALGGADSAEGPKEEKGILGVDDVD